MYSELILQTFDAYQAQQQLTLAKHQGQHVTSDNDYYRKESRHRALDYSSLSHALSQKSLSSCRSQHRERDGSCSGASKVGVAA